MISSLSSSADSHRPAPSAPARAPTPARAAVVAAVTALAGAMAEYCVWKLCGPLVLQLDGGSSYPSNSQLRSCATAPCRRCVPTAASALLRRCSLEAAESGTRDASCRTCCRQLCCGFGWIARTAGTTVEGRTFMLSTLAQSSSLSLASPRPNFALAPSEYAAGRIGLADRGRVDAGCPYLRMFICSNSPLPGVAPLAVAEERSGAAATIDEPRPELSLLLLRGSEDCLFVAIANGF